MAQINGKKHALEILQGLDPKAQNDLLEQMAQSDPEMAQFLQERLVQFHHLTLMSVKMLQELLREISLRDLGMALRGVNEEIRSFFIKNISRSMADEVQEVLNGPPRPLNDVVAAQKNILEIVRAKMERGEIILRDDGEEYV